MFSLVKSTCASCIEEHDCVYCIHCAKSKIFYCKECILDYNKVNNTVGVCPTCKAHYGKQNCYYIYGTDIVPVLSTQIDKYRERIRSSPEIMLMGLFEQIKKDNVFDICSSRSLLLQLYLNRLYKDQHPMETNIQTWCRGIHDCMPLMDMFKNLAKEIASFISHNPDSELDREICKINDRFNHIDYVIVKEDTNPLRFPRIYYYRRTEHQETSVLRKYQFYDLHDRPRLVSITESPTRLSDVTKGFILGSICAEKAIENDYMRVVPLPSIDDLPSDIKEDHDLYGCELQATSPVRFEETLLSRHLERYSVFTLKTDIAPIKLLPTIAELDESLETSAFDTEMHYYGELTDYLKEYLNNAIDKLTSESESVDNGYYRLMHLVLGVNNYIKRILSDDTNNTVKAHRIIDMLIDSIKSETFDIPTFMAQLHMYYMMASPNAWAADLKPIIDEIVRRTLKDPSQATSFEQAVRPLLTCAESNDDGVAQKYVQLPETLSLSLKNILAKNGSTYKLSFVRCVCGGSVIVKDIKCETPVYECTRCHKQLDALPEQEIDPETLKLLESISKRCPVCGTFIQKAEGCNHMFCTNCKNGFNWNDLSKLEDRDNTNPHFREYRHGSSSNLRTLLDDYDRPARKNHEPIEWFGHELFTDMNNAEKRLNEHKESIEKCYKEFINDDRFALKFVNELNINKMRIAFIQNTFDTMMTKAFEVIQENQAEGSHKIRAEQRCLVAELSKEYNGGMNVIDAILNALNLSIDCSITMATNLSRGIEEEEYDVPQEMTDEAKAMEQQILAEIAERAQSMQPKEEIMVIGDHNVTIRRG